MKNQVLLALTAALLCAPVWAQNESSTKAADAAAATSAQPASKKLLRHEPCPPVEGSQSAQRRAPNGKCEADLQGGRSYSREDLDRTGATNVGDALRKLDPNFH